MDCIQQFPFQKDKLVDFEIAISEAVQNSVLHDGEDPERKVGIHILYIPKIALLVGVTDDLGPLNIEELKLDVVDENGLPSLAEGGRGLFIMSSLCSIVAYVPDVPHGRMKQFILALVPESQGK